MDYIKIEDCVNGGLYRIDSRNLSFGVYKNAGKCFVGIREKFGNEYLFSEYHVDNGPPFGTVKPRKFLELCPISELNESLGSVDANSGRFVSFEGAVANGSKGWYYLDTGESSESISPTYVVNKELYAWLKEKEVQYQGT